MTPATLETYGARIEKYQRREQMAVWVAAGIAALVAFVGARALDGAPRIFTELVFTGAALAGVALALARVGFEWQATLLKRKTAGQFTLADTPLEKGDQPWPVRPELYWMACLVLIIGAWVMMLAGIWWHRPKPVVHVSNERAEFQTFPLGGIGPFADCSADVPPVLNNRLQAIAQQYRDRVALARHSSLIILVGIADNKRLSPACAGLFGTNEHLAAERARHVRAQLEGKLSGERVRPNYVVLTSGPRRLEARQEKEGRQQDRAVDVWLAAEFLRVPSDVNP